MQRAKTNRAGMKRAAVLACWLLGLLGPVTTATPVRADTVAVSGRVLGPDDEPVVGADIIIATGSWKVKTLELRTDAEGRFVANIEVSEFALDRHWVASAAIIARGLGLAGSMLRRGENTLRLGHGVSLSGVVNDPEGQPVAGVLVRLSRINAGRKILFNVYADQPPLRDRFLMRTGPDGRWRFDDMPVAGSASVELDDPRYVRTSVQAPLSPMPATAPPLVVQPGANITGRVIHKNGEPAADIEIMVQSQDKAQVKAQGKTGEDGTYKITGLPAGTFRVMADAEFGEWVALAVEGVKTQAGQETRAGDLVLERGVLLEGTVVDADTNAPVMGARTEATGAHGISRSTYLDKAGRYSIRVMPGEVRFYSMAQPPDYLSVSKRYVAVIGPETTAIEPIQL